MNYLNTSSPTPLELFMADQFGLDRVRISYPYVEPNSELSITRNDTWRTFFSINQTKRTFVFPRVDIVYNRKRYFGYVQIDTKVHHHKSWFTEEFVHVIDDDQFVANLKIMLQDIIDGVIYN
jgi:hypothetical protein